MMKCTATRGVCIGPQDYMVTGEQRFLDRQTAIFLLSIGAVVESAGDPEPIANDSPFDSSGVTSVDDAG